jgi:DNA polymerase-1
MNFQGPRPRHLKILSRPDGLEPWLERLRPGTLAVDTETTGLNWMIDRVGGICLAAGDTAVFAYAGALEGTARWLAQQVKRRRKLVFHNAKYDLHMLRGTFGIHINYLVHDTMVESFLLDNRGASAYTGSLFQDHSLKGLAAQFVDPEAYDHEKELMRAIKQAGGKTKGDWLMAPEVAFGPYSGMDPWYTLQLHQQFLPRLVHWMQPAAHYPSLYSLYEQERWLILAFRDMEERGIKVRRSYLEEWRVTLEQQLKEQERKLWKLAGKHDINWASTTQLAELLYTKMKIPCTRWTGNNKPSTDEVSLMTMRHPIGAALVKFRELSKQHSSYATSLLEAIASDGAIHANFKSTGARTGRSSCSDPNLQQQTRESGVRRAYYPRKGTVFRFADYSQVEMRFAADAADEQTLIRGFNDDDDFDTHRATAQVMYGLPEPIPRQRKFGKILNFTTIFGGGVKKVAEQLQERLSLDEVLQALKELKYRLQPGELPHFALATLLKERYNHAMPNIRTGSRREQQLCEQRGFVMNAFGRHRYMDRGKEYAAFNSRIQGTAGDQAKAGLVAVYREMQVDRGEVALLMLIHDELVYESEGRKSTDRRILQLMRNDSFKVPIIADMSGSSTSWQDKEKIAV